jgi:RimJ/RimL family protein N-acetyltransferase
MEVREFHPYDLEDLQFQPMQADYKEETISTQQGMALKEAGDSFTATVNGIPIGCIGLVNHWKGRRYVWAYLSDEAGKHMVSLTRAIKRWLKYHGEGRIETAVDCRFEEAIRWVEMLGFEREGKMRHWSPTGDDFWLYARIR